MDALASTDPRVVTATTPGIASSIPASIATASWSPRRCRMPGGSIACYLAGCGDHRVFSADRLRRGCIWVGARGNSRRSAAPGLGPNRASVLAS
jgi:hypothetical protein